MPQLLDKRLEQLHDIDLALAQRRGIVGHRAVGDARQSVGIKTGAAQVVLQAKPGRRHLADRRDPPAEQVGEGEIRVRLAADQKKRIAGHRLANADKVAIGPGLIELVDPHRSAPADIDRPGKEPIRRRPRRRCTDELDLDPFTGERAPRKARVIRRIKQPAQRFLQNDRHTVGPNTL